MASAQARALSDAPGDFDVQTLSAVATYRRGARITCTCCLVTKPAGSFPETNSKHCTACRDSFIPPSQEASGSKTCTHCRKSKPAGAFHPLTATANTLDTCCKACKATLRRIVCAKRKPPTAPAVPSNPAPDASMSDTDQDSSSSGPSVQRGCDKVTRSGRTHRTADVTGGGGVKRKRCILCQVEKVADAFHKRSANPDGRDKRCRACRSQPGVEPRRSKQQRTTPPPPPPPRSPTVWRTCIKCVKTKPSTEFNFKDGTTSTLRQCCRGCENLPRIGGTKPSTTSHPSANATSARPEVEPTPIGLRTCSRCKVAQPRGDFNRQLRRKDGLRTECRACQKEQSARARLRQSEAARAAASPEMDNPVSSHEPSEVSPPQIPSKVTGLHESLQRCTRCKIDKHPSEFSLNSSKVSGLQSQCRLCDRIARQERMLSKTARAPSGRGNPPLPIATAACSSGLHSRVCVYCHISKPLTAYSENRTCCSQCHYNKSRRPKDTDADVPTPSAPPTGSPNLTPATPTKARLRSVERSQSRDIPTPDAPPPSLPSSTAQDDEGSDGLDCGVRTPPGSPEPLSRVNVAELPGGVKVDRLLFMNSPAPAPSHSVPSSAVPSQPTPRGLSVGRDGHESGAGGGQLSRMKLILTPDHPLEVQKRMLGLLGAVECAELLKERLTLPKDSYDLVEQRFAELLLGEASQ